MSRNNYAGQLRQRGSHIASDVMGIGSVLKDATADQLHAIRDFASDKLGALRDGAASMGRNTRDRVNGIVTESPWKSMAVAAGVAAGAGILAGMFFRRR